MMSCHVSMLPRSRIDGAHSNTSSTHAVKNHARETYLLTAVARRSNRPSLPDTEDGWSDSESDRPPSLFADLVTMAVRCPKRRSSVSPQAIGRTTPQHPGTVNRRPVFVF